MTFHDHSKQIVEDFLGTVAYVDDLIFASKKEVQPEVVSLTANMRETVATNEIPKKVEKNIPQQLDPNIDPLTFTNAFLEKGIHCALIEVTNGNELLEPIKKTLKKSDVVILDWQMHGDLGVKATELLLSVMEDNNKLGLKLIIIYTENDDFTQILKDSIIPKLDEIGLEDGVLDDTGCTYLNGYTKVTVLKKENGTKSKTSVSVNELPERVIEEFTNITEGLVSNTALRAISIIRENTHKLIGLLNNSLDPAFLAHRALLPNPDDSEEQILDIIGSEVKSLLIRGYAIQSISKDAIREYLEQNFPETDIDFLFPSKIEFDTIKLPEKITREELLKLTDVGIESIFTNYETSTADKIKFAKNCHINLAEQYCYNGIDPNISNINFANLTTTKQRINSEYLPTLTLGAILKSTKGLVESFWLCLQPKCDSVRFIKNREFLFASLKKDENFVDFDFIIEEEGGYIYFKIDVSVYKAKYFKFKSNENKLVKASADSGKVIFKGETQMEWVGELKNDFAQQVSNKFASNLSRVATNHAEWLRRS